jgi:integrase
LAVLLGCGLRRAELSGLRLEHLQSRDGRWVIGDLVGKGRHLRTVPIPAWVKEAVDSWVAQAEISGGALFRAIGKTGKPWGDGFTPKVVWSIVKIAARASELEAVAPHDLRRTCARLCHLAGGELEQIQFLLGHRSVQTTERHLGNKQHIHDAVNDRIVIGLAKVQT